MAPLALNRLESRIFVLSDNLYQWRIQGGDGGYSPPPLGGSRKKNIKKKYKKTKKGPFENKVLEIREVLKNGYRLGV